MSALPRPDLPPGPHRDLTAALHELHHEAGWPSLRRLAADAGCSHTTVSKTFSSPALPSWGTLELLVESMKGDASEFHDLWLAASNPTPAAPTGPRIAGRRSELSALRRHLESGTGLLLVMGEAGMGKTLLVSTASEPAASDVFVATGHCLPLSTEVSLLPMADILQEVYDCDDGSWIESVLAVSPDHVRALVGRLLPQVSTAQTEQTALLPDSRHLLLWAIGATLNGLRSRRPFALLVEDLHWADPTTRDLVEHLVARGTEVSLVGTWRTEDSTTSTEAAEWLTRIRRLPTVTELPLVPLTREETAQQLALLDGREPTAEALTSIHGRSLGLPLFTEQLAAHAHDGRDLPSLLETLLSQRLSGIGEEAWLLARVLGVADRPLPESILAEAAGITSAAQARAMHELRDKRLLAVHAASAETQLRHPLLAEAVRGRLLVAEKTSDHRRLAAALSGVESADPAEIALHWREAAEPAHELPWRARAGHRARERLDPGQEAEHWLRVVELWPSEVGTVELADCADRDEALFHALRACEECDEWSARALALADARLSELRDVATNTSARLHELMARVHAQHDHHALAIDLARQSVELFRQLPVGPGLARALLTFGSLVGEDNRPQEGLLWGRKALDVARAVDDPVVLFDATVALAAREAYSGDLGNAMARIDALRADGPAPSWQQEMWLGMYHTDILLTYNRPLAEVEEAGRASVELSRSPGLAGAGVMVKINIAEAMVRAGQVSRAASLLVPPEQDGSTQVSSLIALWARMEWARIEVCRGRLAEARRAIAELDAVPMSEPPLMMWCADSAAQLELWSDQPGSAWRRLRVVVEALLDRIEAETLAPLFVLAARAAADCVGDDRDPDALVVLEGLRRRVSMDPFDGVWGDSPAWRASWDAELARLSDHETLDVWIRATAEWDRITRPHEAAYSRWRAAMVARREGRGAAAARLLERAATDAREHVPLHGAIRATADGVR
ncbi:ATP-binding protein [Nocardioides pantholopis]|uniref:ATP-binding protein n=1 Tax=Nocardioides pantholopis TaxID=2483798 RepID=UPI000FDA8DCB|nr:AAA family ATPase [Nocardioides pantholopis]